MLLCFIWNNEMHKGYREAQTLLLLQCCPAVTVPATAYIKWKNAQMA
jgi:hypothetical protein